LVFEQKDLRVIASLDPKVGKPYVKTIRGGISFEGLDNIYKVTTQTKDYINPTTDGNLIWRSISSCTSNSDEGLENWK